MTIRSRLQQLGVLADAELPLAQSLLLIGAAEQGVDDITAYEAQIVAMHDALTIYMADNLQPTLEDKIAALNQIIRDDFGYYGDVDGYEQPEHINFLTVLQRRCGIPVALGVLYAELAERQGWPVVGLNFPGHFLLRFDDGPQRAIVDPFEDGAIMQASDLRQVLKQVMGHDAELHHDYYLPVTKRDIILRFCNNRKSRLIQAEDYAGAMRMIDLEMLIAPHEPRLLFDAGMVSARLQQLQKAINYLDRFTVQSTDTKSIAQARNTIHSLQRLLQ